MSGDAAVGLERDRIQRIEHHCVDAWPATETRRWSDGWILRATPGLPGRGRSNHALAPIRTLSPTEYDGVLTRVSAFADEHGTQCGLQVGPLDLHIDFLNELQARGWSVQPSVCVLTAHVVIASAKADPDFDLTVTDYASDEWIAAWRACEPQRPDVQDHVDTVFRYLKGAARFMHYGDSAVGISVEEGGYVGLFCIAVNPALRRHGLGTKLVGGVLSRNDSSSIAYLQVFGSNEAGLALYGSLGFTESHRYCHCIPPA